MKKLRWKKQEAERGLAGIGAPPRGFIYHDGENTFASVNALGGGWHMPLKGWYWVAGWSAGIPHKNTCGTPCETPEEAKKQAQEYVKANLDGKRK